jgi:hypothetical protein
MTPMRFISVSITPQVLRRSGMIGILNGEWLIVLMKW